MSDTERNYIINFVLYLLLIATLGCSTDTSISERYYGNHNRYHAYDGVRQPEDNIAVIYYTGDARYYPYSIFIDNKYDADISNLGSVGLLPGQHLLSVDGCSPKHEIECYLTSGPIVVKAGHLYYMHYKRKSCGKGCYIPVYWITDDVSNKVVWGEPPWWKLR
jgi:hypothetical protein